MIVIVVQSDHWVFLVHAVILINARLVMMVHRGLMDIFYLPDDVLGRAYLVPSQVLMRALMLLVVSLVR